MVGCGEAQGGDVGLKLSPGQSPSTKRGKNGNIRLHVGPTKPRSRDVEVKGNLDNEDSLDRNCAHHYPGIASDTTGTSMHYSHISISKCALRINHATGLWPTG